MPNDYSPGRAVDEEGVNTRVWRTSYDVLASLTSETGPESGATTYAYDANSNLTRRTDLTYGLLILLAGGDLSLADVVAELERRHRP